MYDPSDTIVAVSSSVGGVRSIIRVTGPQALSICQQLFEKIKDQRSKIKNRVILSGSVWIDDDLKVHALLYPFLAPHSYTGEDLIELHVFAGACLVEALVARLLSCGCRAAGPGEFTARAYLNGKLDLAQAEAVNEVISSSNRLQLEAAERLLGGRLTQATEAIRTALLDVLSVIEAGLDFSTEDIEFISPDQAVTRLSETLSNLEELLAGSIRNEELMDLPAVGIAGAPNAGKSSLLNALLGWERSIVSAQPKTTRDVLTGILIVVPAEDDGVSSAKREVSSGAGHAPRLPSSNLKPEISDFFQCILFDCAGLIASPDNVLDELAQRAAIEALQHCSAVLFCVDSSKSDWSEDVAVRRLIEPSRVIYVATKSDLAGAEDAPRKIRELETVFSDGFVSVSAKEGRGLERLLQAIERVVCGTPEEVSSEARVNILALNARHRQAVTEAIDNVRHAVEEVRQGREEVAVTMIRAACEAISGIEQQHLDEQVLDRIFSRFCLGK